MCSDAIFETSLSYDKDIWIAATDSYVHFYIIKRPLWDACLCMGDLQAPPAPSAFCFAYNSLTVRRILFKFGRFRQ